MPHDKHGHHEGPFVVVVMVVIGIDICTVH